MDFFDQDPNTHHVNANTTKLAPTNDGCNHFSVANWLPMALQVQDMKLEFSGRRK